MRDSQDKVSRLAELLSEEALTEHETNHAERELCCYGKPLADRIGNEVESVRTNNNSE